MSWFQLMRKPTNGSKCPNAVEAEKTGRVLSLSDADSHICTHADPLTKEARRQNYPESLSVVKGTVTLSNTSYKGNEVKPLTTVSYSLISHSKFQTHLLHFLIGNTGK